MHYVGIEREYFSARKSCLVATTRQYEEQERESTKAYTGKVRAHGESFEWKYKLKLKKVKSFILVSFFGRARQLIMSSVQDL